MSEEIQSTQDKYSRADKTNEPPQIKENEVRITTRGRVKRYVDYATALFQGGQDSEEKKDSKATGDDDDDNNNNTRGPTKRFDTIVLKATGKAINKAVTTAEVVKRTIGDLHQETRLETLEIVDVWEPKEEGLQKVETTRRVASISIKLSRKIEDVDVKAAGYQKPIAQETGFNLGYRGGYGRNRGGYGGGYRGGYRGNYNNRRYQGDRRRNDRRRGGNRNFNRGGYNNNNNNYNNRGGARGGRYNNNNYNNYNNNRNFNQGNNNFNQMNQGYRGGGGGGGPQQRMGGPGGGYNRQGNFGGSPRRYPRDGGRRGRGGPRRGGYY